MQLLLEKLVSNKVSRHNHKSQGHKTFFMNEGSRRTWINARKHVMLRLCTAIQKNKKINK